MNTKRFFGRVGTRAFGGRGWRALAAGAALAAATFLAGCGGSLSLSGGSFRTSHATVVTERYGYHPHGRVVVERRWYPGWYGSPGWYGGVHRRWHFDDHRDHRRYGRGDGFHDGHLHSHRGRIDRGPWGWRRH